MVDVVAIRLCFFRRLDELVNCGDVVPDLVGEAEEVRVVTC